MRLSKQSFNSKKVSPHAKPHSRYFNIFYSVSYHIGKFSRKVERTDFSSQSIFNSWHFSLSVTPSLLKWLPAHNSRLASVGWLGVRCRALLRQNGTRCIAEAPRINFEHRNFAFDLESQISQFMPNLRTLKAFSHSSRVWFFISLHYFPLIKHEEGMPIDDRITRIVTSKAMLE